MNKPERRKGDRCPVGLHAGVSAVTEPVDEQSKTLS
jgi:hypothetical protein